MKVNKIKARMVEMGFTQSEVAQKIGMNQSTLSLKLSGKRPLSINEAENICKILDIGNENFGEYFFNA